MPALADRVGLALRDLYDRVCFADDAAAMVTSDAEITTQSRPGYRLPGAGWFISGSSTIAKIGPRSSRCFSLRLSCSTEWRIPAARTALWLGLHQAARPFAAEADLAVDDVLAVPRVLTGTIPEIVEQRHTARDR